MSDKYPALETIDNDLASTESGKEFDSDFLSREKELLGEEFKTDQDADVLNGSDDDDINDFKEQFPEVDETEAEKQEQAAAETEAETADEGFEGFNGSNDNHLIQGESEHLKEWKERRELEIEKREQANAKSKQDIVDKAQKTIDDFYDNYNNKREQHTKEVLKEQEQFLEKRDGFLKRGTLWDRVNELVGEVGEPTADENRDKTRFKGLLTKLKGKENVPGAGGY